MLKLRKTDVKVTNWERYYPFITEAEAKCKCGCGAAYVSKRFADKLLKGRHLSSVPYRFSSFCRCPDHNAEVGGKNDSAHISTPSNLTEAADITYHNNNELFIIVRSLIYAGFTRIGINHKRKFVHVDNDEDKPQRVLFNY